MSIKFVDVFEPANETEAQAISTVLRQQGIRAEVLSFHDTAFDGVFQAQRGWGRIRVKEEDAEDAQRIIDEWQSAEVSEPGAESDKEPDEEHEEEKDEKKDEDEVRTEEDTQATTPRSRLEGRLGTAWRVLRPILLIGSLGLNAVLLFGKGGGLPGGTTVIRDRQGYIVAKLYYREGESAPYRFEEFDDEGNMSAEGFDDDGDSRYERMVNYDRKGKKVSELRDANADGRFELMLEYFRDDLVAGSSDDDDDGRYDRMEVYYEQKLRAKYTDRNKDGLFDQFKLVTKTQPAPLLDDVDRDGFPEVLTCKRPDGKIWKVNAVTCQAETQ
jgi:hypothetical protein